MRTIHLAASALGLALLGACTSHIDRQTGDAAPAGSASPSATSSAGAMTGATATVSVPPSAAGTGTTTATTTALASGRCHTNQLRAEVDLIYPSGQAGSEQDAMLGLTNNGAACTMSGYTDIQLLDGNGQPRITQVDRSDNSGKNPATKFTLQHGQTAWSLIAWRYTPNGDESNSQPLCGGKVYQAQITPPDETAHLTVGTAFGTVCNYGSISESPLSLTRPQP